MSWDQVKLSDISKAIQTGPFGSQLHQSDYSETGTPVVMPKDIIHGRISEESIARVSKDYVERLCKYEINDGDIIYARRGDVGRCAITTFKEEGWLCGTGCLRVTIDRTKAEPMFVFYQLQKADTIGWVVNHAVGSTMLNLNTSILSDVPIQIPELKIQSKIVNILSAYDDLIENNKKQISLLEEAARRLYKEWFVDMRFPGHETTKIIDGVPEGWEVKQFSDVFSFVRGKSYSGKEIDGGGHTLLINLKNIKAFGGYNRNVEKQFSGDFKSEQSVVSGDIIMGVTDMTQERRIVGHVALVPNLRKPAIISMDLIKLIPHSISKNYLYAALRYGGYAKQIANRANGVNVLHLKPDTIMNMKMLLPHKPLESKFTNVIDVLFLRMERLNSQIDILTEARNRLLPKLMSGEIEVKP